MVVREIDAVKNDDGITRPLPDGLKLAPECVNFESISRFASSDPRLHWRVLDLFAGKDWTATGCSFAIERLTYHFRSSQPVPPDESPYGVALSIRDDLWEARLKS